MAMRYKNVVGKIIKDMRKEKLTRNYASKNRYIPQYIYEKLKKKKVCDKCEEHRVDLQIHHKIPVSQGGTNTEENLQVLCNYCHDKAHGRI
jgi:5-methylcytosine-specific restriction endonuclease McrA